MTPISVLFAILATVILLPMIPAYLLFKLLPTSGNVQGRLQGLQIKLGGAFAGYFIVVVLILSQLQNMKEIAFMQSEVWTVQGRIVDTKGNAVQPLGATDVELEPRYLDLQPNGYFRATFSTTPSPTGSGFEFPTLSVGHEGYRSQTISLGPPIDADDRKAQKKRDPLQHLIVLNPIVLGDLPSYAPKGEAPTPVSSPNYGDRQ